MQNKLLWLSLLVVLALGAIHAVGNIFYFYWDSFWFDGVAHFAGGFAVAAIFLWVWYVSSIFEKGIPSKREAFLAATLFALFIGVGWEFFEYVYGIANPVGGNYPVDTFHDVMFDLLGGATVGLMGRIRSLYV